MTRIVFAAAVAAFMGAFAGVAQACDDRYPDLCRAAGPAAAASASGNAKRVHTVRLKRHARSSASKWRSRAAVRSAAARRASARVARAKPVVAVPVRVNAQAEIDAAGERRGAASAQRRFRAFIDPNPLTHRYIEAWRGPRLQVGLMLEPASAVAGSLMTTGEGADDGPVGSIAARVLDASVIANHSAIVTGPPLQAAPARPEPPVVSRGSEESTDLFSLRGLMLALGGAATLASALRLLIGA